jgi:hypothetical protein
MSNGMPAGLSLFEMFCSLPDLRSVLKASCYAKGSMDTLLQTVQVESICKELTQQIDALVQKAIQNADEEEHVYLPILNSDLEGSDEDMDPLYEPLSSYHDPIYDVPKPCPLYEDPNQILLQDEFHQRCSGMEGTPHENIPNGFEKPFFSPVSSQHPPTDTSDLQVTACIYIYITSPI